jgi:hypothetical protein
MSHGERWSLILYSRSPYPKMGSTPCGGGKSLCRGQSGRITAPCWHGEVCLTQTPPGGRDQDQASKPPINRLAFQTLTRTATLESSDPNAQGQDGQLACGNQERWRLFER